MQSSGCRSLLLAWAWANVCCLGVSRSTIACYFFVCSASTDLCFACFSEPFTFCCSWCFPWCVVRSQRLTLLENDLSRYECWGGLWPCCRERCNSCTEGHGGLCLWCEVLCCMPCAVHGNRHLLQSRFSIRNSCLDNTLLWAMCICQVLEFCARCFGFGDPRCSCMLDFCYCWLLGCMNAQQAKEIHVRLAERQSRSSAAGRGKANKVGPADAPARSMHMKR